MSENKEYIERGALMEEIRKHIETIGINAERLVARFAPADVEPVVRGKWTPNKRHAGFMVCDQCRFGIPINTMVVMECNRRSDEREFCVCAGDVELAYCPNCGAHMERSGSGE